MKEETFFSQVLYYDGSGTPALAGSPASLQPGKSFQLRDPSEKVFLAGGFPAFTPRSACALSPTLQLNGDLGKFSESELKFIAEAELDRFNSSTCRSYTREPDTRVCVLSDYPSLLNGFLDTYGGIVHAEPFLLQGYDNDYTTGDDLHIEPREDGYQLNYTVRTPINEDKCTYCGSCGPICPEDCLSENLFLDLSICSFCKKCMEVCPADAIDLYRAQKRTLHIPAIILLGECSVELPDDQSRIFSGTSLEPFFSTLIPLRVDETVSCNPALCQYIPRLDAGCISCVKACPHDAVLKTTAGIKINHERCMECGSCVSSCPTGALQYERFDDQSFIRWFEKVPISKNRTLIIGKEKQLHALWWKKNLPDNKNKNVLFLEHPNIRALTTMHLLFLLSMGAEKIILLEDPEGIVPLPVTREIDLANTVFSSLFGKEKRVIIAQTQKSLPSESESESSPSPLTQTYSDFRFTGRREKLGSILTFLLTQSSNTGDEVTLITDQPFAPFGSVLCDDDICTHCGACLNECKIQALTTDEETLSLNHLSIQCIQCGVCIQVCPEKALDLQQGLQLTPAFFAPHELTRAEPVICLECHQPFGTRKSFDRVMEKLQSHSSYDPENNFFEYCEKCRVIKLFESQQQ